MEDTPISQMIDHVCAALKAGLDTPEGEAELVKAEALNVPDVRVRLLAESAARRRG